MAAMAEWWSVVKTSESPVCVAPTRPGASEGEGVVACVWARPKGTVFAANMNRPTTKTTMTSHLPLSFKARMPQVGVSARCLERVRNTRHYTTLQVV